MSPLTPPAQAPSLDKIDGALRAAGFKVRTELFRLAQGKFKAVRITGRYADDRRVSICEVGRAVIGCPDARVVRIDGDIVVKSVAV